MRSSPSPGSNRASSVGKSALATPSRSGGSAKGRADATPRANATIRAVTLGRPWRKQAHDTLAPVLDGDAPARRRTARRALAVSGVTLLALGQALTLVHVRPLSDYWYGVVWTGFLLASDAIVAARTGASLVLDRPRDLALMFLASAGLWWLFEAANVVLFASWAYSASPDVPFWVQRLRSTYFFATLLPSTWQATLLALALSRPAPRSLAPSDAAAPRSLASARPSTPLALGALAAGAVFAALTAALPELSLPLGLISLGLIIDALNLLRRRPSLLAHLRRGSPALPLAIAAGNVAAGFIGEMWNYPASPRWSYHVPYADVLRVFAMPLPGYLGYAALALDLFALYHFVRPRFRAGESLPPGHPLSLTGLG